MDLRPTEKKIMPGTETLGNLGQVKSQFLEEKLLCYFTKPSIVPNHFLNVYLLTCR